MASLGIVAATAAVAHAQPAHPNYVYSSTFSSSGTGAPDQLSQATAIAVVPASHDILVADPGQNRIAVFEPDGGTSATYSTEFGRGDLANPAGVAVDAASGRVYVSDAGNQRIVRYTTNGATPPVYTRDVSYAGPAAGPGPGHVGTFGPIAIDQRTHELLVADQGNERISRYSSAGAFVSSFDRADAAGRSLHTLTGIAVGPDGEIDVVDALGDVVFGAASRVHRFDPSGRPLGDLDPVPSPRSIGVDPTTGMVLVAGASGFSDTQQIFSFIDGEPAGQVAFPSPAAARGLAVDGTGSGLLYSLTTDKFGNGTDGVDVYSPVLAPGVATAAAGDVRSRSLTLRGTVDAGGRPTTPHFEYSTDDGATWTPLADLPALGGSGEQPVEEPLADLEPNTDYLVRLVATNADTSSTTRERTVRTATAPPQAVTGTPTDVTASSARLNGKVNAFGQQTTYFFEYGPTTDYGTQVPAAGDAVAGAGRSPRVVSRPISGLTPGATYHARLVAQSAAGTTRGDDVTFTAADPSALPARGLEQVTPADKGGSGVDPRTIDWQSGLDGNAVAYQLNSGAVGGDSAVVVPRTLSRRGGDGWSSRAIDPPFDPIDASAGSGGPFAPGIVQLLTIAVSRDLSHALVVSNKALTNDAPPAASAYVYVRDTRDGSYALVASGDSTLLIQAAAGTGFFYAGSEDFGTVFLTSSQKLTPDALDDPTQVNLYRWRRGTLTREDVLPDGDTAPQGIQGGEFSTDVTSADGDEVLFYVPGYLTDPGVYLRGPSGTRALSVSRAAGQPTDPQEGSPVAITPDGRYVFFAVGTSVPLTDDAPAAPNDLYRYDTTTQALVFVSPDATPAVSEDGRSALLFVPTVGYRLWRDGSGSRLVLASTRAAPDGSLGMSVSPDGRYAGFLSPDPSPEGLTNADARTCRGIFAPVCVQAYVYDADSGTLACASCRPDGGPPAGDATFTRAGASLQPPRPRYLSTRGDLFFDTPTPLTATDVNGRRDVYAFRAGERQLLSGGRDADDASFGAASPSGDDVFFSTTEGLVPGDTDGAVDVYDARVGGGLAAQRPEPQDATCAGSECREPGPGPGPASSPASQAAPPPRVDALGRPPGARVSIRSASFSRTSARLVVRASTAGRLRVSGARVVASTRSARNADVYTLRAAFTRSTRAARSARRTVKVALTVSLTPAFGARAVTKLNRTLRK